MASQGRSSLHRYKMFTNEKLQSFCCEILCIFIPKTGLLKGNCVLELIYNQMLGRILQLVLILAFKFVAFPKYTLNGKELVEHHFQFEMLANAYVLTVLYSLAMVRR